MRISVETEVESIPAQVLKQNIQLSCFFFYEGKKKGEEKITIINNNENYSDNNY
jgi:hypothetical protein